MNALERALRSQAWWGAPLRHLALHRLRARALAGNLDAWLCLMRAGLDHPDAVLRAQAEETVRAHLGPLVKRFGQQDFPQLPELAHRLREYGVLGAGAEFQVALRRGENPLVEGLASLEALVELLEGPWEEPVRQFLGGLPRGSGAEIQAALHLLGRKLDPWREADPDGLELARVYRLAGARLRQELASALRELGLGGLLPRADAPLLSSEWTARLHDLLARGELDLLASELDQALPRQGHAIVQGLAGRPDCPPDIAALAQCRCEPCTPGFVTLDFGGQLPLWSSDERWLVAAQDGESTGPLASLRLFDQTGERWTQAMPSLVPGNLAWMEVFSYRNSAPFASFSLDSRLLGSSPRCLHTWESSDHNWELEEWLSTGRVDLWDPESGRSLGQVPLPGKIARLFPGRSTVLAHLENGEIHAVDPSGIVFSALTRGRLDSVHRGEWAVMSDPGEEGLHVLRLGGARGFSQWWAGRGQVMLVDDLILTGDRSGFWQILELETCRTTGSFEPRGAVREIRRAMSSGHLVVLTETHLELRDALRGQLIATQPLAIPSPLLHPSGELLLAREHPFFRLYSVFEAEPFATWRADEARDTGFSPLGSCLAQVGNSSTRLIRLPPYGRLDTLDLAGVEPLAAEPLYAWIATLLRRRYRYEVELGDSVRRGDDIELA